VTRNYGIDIILLTVIVKVLFLPLSQKSMKSMRDMQRLQPQMAKLREKFKDDRERLNKEMMELYRRHRVNPSAAACRCSCSSRCSSASIKR